ncbi:MAG: hypothetical protein EXR75_02345 [Myxococcales bacterium]|nr:hypothetical protein [Myxococcales bacterium]
MNRTVPFVALLAAVVFFAGGAAAQEPVWLGDRQYREGAGFLFGDFEVHPGVAADVGYDSNYFHRDTSEDPISALRLRVSPSFSIATLGAQRRGDTPPPAFGFRLDAGATYNEFIPVSGSAVGQENLAGQRNVSGFARLNFDILQGQVWSGRIFGGVVRSLRPSSEGLSEASFNRIAPDAGTELVWTPGSGLLDWRLGYAFSGSFFENTSFSGLNSIQHELTTRGRWRFLPRTALIYDARLGFVSYPSAAAAGGKTGSHPLRTRAGLNGLITPSFGALAMVGWGASFYSGGADDFDSVIAQAELKWFFTPAASSDPLKMSAPLSGLTLGFARDFQDSLIGTYAEKDQGYVRFNYLFGGAFLLLAEAAAGAVVFPAGANASFGQPAGWTDLRVDGRVFAEYRIKDFVGLDAELSYTGYFSNTALAFPNVTGVDRLAYQQIAAFIGARWFM